MRLQFNNFRIIEQADISIDGITLIRGQNDSGKTTVMRGLRTVLKNQSGDSCVRYGSKGFNIVIEVPTAAGLRRVSFTRKIGGSPLLQIDGKEPLEKLGRLTLSEIDPSFPLKTLQLGEDKFLPQFVFQKQVPVFDQVDAYAFFASMFESVAKLTKHNLVVRSRVAEATSDASALEAKSNNLLEMYNAAEASLQAQDKEKIFLRFSRLETGLVVRAVAQNMKVSLDKSKVELAGLEKYAVLATYNFTTGLAYVQALEALREKAAALATVKQNTELLRASHLKAAWSETCLGTLAPSQAILQTAQDLLVRTKVLRDTQVAREAFSLKYAAATAAGEALPALQAQSDFLSRVTDARARLVFAETARKDSVARLSATTTVAVLVPAAKALGSLRAVQGEVFRAKSAVSSNQALLDEAKALLGSITVCPTCGQPYSISEVHHG